MSGRRVLIVEEAVSGHYLVYVALLIRAAVESGDNVVVALAEGAENSEEYELHLSAFAEQFQLVSLIARVTPRSVRELQRRLRPDVTVVPNGDRFAMRLALRRPRSMSGLVSILVMADPRSDVTGSLIRRLMMRTKLVLLRRTESMTEVSLAWLRPPGSSTTLAEKTANDPVLIDGIDLESSLSTALRSLDQSKYWFGLVGAIGRWKNLPMVLDAFSELDPNRVGLLIAGQVSEEVRAGTSARISGLRSMGARIELMDRLLSNAEMSQAVDFVDCVVLAYSTHAPPSTLGKAAALGTQVVAAGSPAFIRHVEQVGLGGLTSPLTVEGLLSSLQAAIAAPAPLMRTDLGAEAFVSALLCSDRDRA